MILFYDLPIYGTVVDFHSTIKHHITKVPVYSALSRLKDKVINELNLEIQPQIIEFLKQEYQHMYKDQWEKHWNEEDLFKERIEYRYYRKYEMPNPFKYWDERNTWQQFYFAKDSQGNFYYQRGGSGSSDQRFCHCIYGHLYLPIRSIGYGNV